MAAVVSQTPSAGPEEARALFAAVFEKYSYLFTNKLGDLWGMDFADLKDVARSTATRVFDGIARMKPSLPLLMDLRILRVLVIVAWARGGLWENADHARCTSFVRAFSQDTSTGRDIFTAYPEGAKKIERLLGALPKTTAPRLESRPTIHTLRVWRDGVEPPDTFSLDIVLPNAGAPRDALRYDYAVEDGDRMVVLAVKSRNITGNRNRSILTVRFPVTPVPGTRSVLAPQTYTFVIHLGLDRTLTFSAVYNPDTEQWGAPFNEVAAKGPRTSAPTRQRGLTTGERDLALAANLANGRADAAAHLARTTPTNEEDAAAAVKFYLHHAHNGRAQIEEAALKKTIRRMAGTPASTVTRSLDGARVTFARDALLSEAARAELRAYLERVYGPDLEDAVELAFELHAALKADAGMSVRESVDDLLASMARYAPQKTAAVVEEITEETTETPGMTTAGVRDFVMARMPTATEAEIEALVTAVSAWVETNKVSVSTAWRKLQHSIGQRPRDPREDYGLARDKWNAFVHVRLDPEASRCKLLRRLQRVLAGLWAHTTPAGRTGPVMPFAEFDTVEKANLDFAKTSRRFELAMEILARRPRIRVPYTAQALVRRVGAVVGDFDYSDALKTLRAALYSLENGKNIENRDDLTKIIKGVQEARGLGNFTLPAKTVLNHQTTNEAANAITTVLGYVIVSRKEAVEWLNDIKLKNPTTFFDAKRVRSDASALSQAIIRRDKTNANTDTAVGGVTYQSDFRPLDENGRTKFNRLFADAVTKIDDQIKGMGTVSKLDAEFAALEKETVQYGEACFNVFIADHTYNADPSDLTKNAFDEAQTNLRKSLRDVGLRINTYIEELSNALEEDVADAVDNVAGVIAEQTGRLKAIVREVETNVGILVKSFNSMKNTEHLNVAARVYSNCCTRISTVEALVKQAYVYAASLREKPGTDVTEIMGPVEKLKNRTTGIATNLNKARRDWIAANSKSSADPESDSNSESEPTNDESDSDLDSVLPKKVSKSGYRSEDGSLQPADSPPAPSIAPAIRKASDLSTGTESDLLARGVTDVHDSLVKARTNLVALQPSLGPPDDRALFAHHLQTLDAHLERTNRLLSLAPVVFITIQKDAETLVHAYGADVAGPLADGTLTLPGHISGKGDRVKVWIRCTNKPLPETNFKAEDLKKGDVVEGMDHSMFISTRTEFFGEPLFRAVVSAIESIPANAGASLAYLQMY